MQPESVGQYQVVRELGRGGMGQVYLARDKELGRLVALKFRRRGGAEDEGARLRFRREARALAALSDAGIVTIFEIGEDSVGEFIAMEYVDGKNLRQAAEADDLDTESLLRIIAKIAASLESAHRAGVLHRDVKPENIMISREGDVKVVDFGIARQVEEGAVEQAVARVESESEVYGATLPIEPQENAHTTTSRAFGTPAYMAPELLHGEEATPESDVYALGISLYELIARRTPYGGNSVAETISSIIDPAVVPRSLADMGLANAQLSSLVSEMMDPLAARRPSMSSVRERLLDMVEPLSVDGVPPAKSTERWLWFALAALVALGALLLVLLVRSRSEESMPNATAISRGHSVPRDTAPLLAIPPIGVRGAPDISESNALADILGTALRSGDVIRVATPDRLRDQIAPAAAADPAWDSAAEAIGARYVVNGVLRQEESRYVLRAEVRDLQSQSSHPVEADAPLADLDALVVRGAEQIAKHLGVETGTIPRPRIETLEDLHAYEEGLLHMQAGRWLPAAERFGIALREDPELFEAWYRRALALSWGAADPTESADAAKQAEALAGSERDAQLMRGIWLYLSGDFEASLAILRPLEEAHPGDRDVLYHLAEAVYHDGSHAAGVALFDALLLNSPRFVMAAWHPFQQSLIRRDELKARRYMAIIRSTKAGKKEEFDLAFALGDYERLADDPEAGEHRRHAQIVLRRDRELEEVYGQTSESKEPLVLIGRLAWASYRGRHALAASHFSSYMSLLEEGSAKARNENVLLQLGEVLVGAGMGKELEALLGRWDSESERHSSLVYQALSIHAAALLGEAERTHAGQRTTGLARSAEAIRAELGGELGRARELWTEALDDPHHYYAYLERAAFLRVLRASADEASLREACAELETPPVFRPALLTVRCPTGE